MKIAINKEKLCKVRVLCGLTINEAARKAGVCIATWAAVEAGKTVPRPATLIKMCNAVGTNAEDIIEMQE